MFNCWSQFQEPETYEENSYVADYVAGLKVAGIQLGIIANHNKMQSNLP